MCMQMSKGGLEKAKNVWKIFIKHELKSYKVSNSEDKNWCYEDLCYGRNYRMDGGDVEWLILSYLDFALSSQVLLS